MNNLQTLRNLFQLNKNTVAEAIAISPATLTNFEIGAQIPTIQEWKNLAEYYSNQFHVQQTQSELIEPIHFRLSIDYLMNLGITMSDLIAIKWYFENTRPELGPLAVALFEPNIGHTITRLTTKLSDVLEDFAGYLLLNQDGSLNQFINERNDNHVSDWRLVLYKDANKYVDITDLISYFVDLPDFTRI